MTLKGLKLNWLGRVRLASGLILVGFLASHLLNHSLGILSLDAMEAGRRVFLGFWRNPVMSVVLPLALVIHTIVTLTSLYRRRTLRGLTRGEIVQITLGLAIPLFMAKHIVATRILNETFGVQDTYAFVLWAIWVADPLAGVQQVAGLLVAWVHGCLGLHYWLRLKPWYRAAVPYLYAAALLIPVLALTGFSHGGREVALLMQDPVWRETFFAELDLPADAADWATGVRNGIWAMMIAGLVIVGVGRGLRHLWERRAGIITLTYPGERRVQIKPGITVLETSRQNDIPHASVCGGRGRCSTCRIRVGAGAEHLAPPSEEEARVLARVGAPMRVRLACQLRPAADLEVIPLLPIGRPRDAARRPAYLQGQEREIAILFADIRQFTKFAETKLPFDVVFVINQYFRYMGTAIERSNGRIDKFIGDGVMALFGLESGPEQGARDALSAAREMAKALAEMNRTLANDLAQPLRVGIGIHVGAVIVGEMGYANVMSVTAIGDAVNTASRLEAATKEFGCQLIVSEAVVRRAGADLSGHGREEVAVRGRQETVPCYTVADATLLDAFPARS